MKKCRYIVDLRVNIMLDFAVALLTESVDWNKPWGFGGVERRWCRSPHGERGLKYIGLLDCE